MTSYKHLQYITVCILWVVFASVLGLSIDVLSCKCLWFLLADYAKCSTLYPQHSWMKPKPKGTRLHNLETIYSMSLANVMSHTIHAELFITYMTSTCFNNIYLLRKLHHTFESISVYTILMEHKSPSKTAFTFPQTQQANFVQYQIQGRSNKKLGRNVRWVPSPVISRDITPGVITPIGINWLFLRLETTSFITSRGPPCVNKHDFSPRQIILRPPIPGQWWCWERRYLFNPEPFSMGCNEQRRYPKQFVSSWLKRFPIC